MHQPPPCIKSNKALLVRFELSGKYTRHLVPPIYLKGRNKKTIIIVEIYSVLTVHQLGGLP